jgi:glycosyltransferase involved in cell wall biosynthesis
MADIYTSCSLMEGFGIPLAEALSCQTPVVAMDSGATAEVVGPGGIIAQPKAVHKFAEIISNLLADRPSLSEMGIKGRHHVKKNFSIQTMLQSTQDSYLKFYGIESPF